MADYDCPIPLIGQAWLLCGFDYAFDTDQDRPRLFAAEGETPLLNLPAALAGDDLESAFFEALARLYFCRYGMVNLVRGVRAWDQIVQDLEQRNMAAD